VENRAVCWVENATKFLAQFRCGNVDSGALTSQSFRRSPAVSKRQADRFKILFLLSTRLLKWHQDLQFEAYRVISRLMHRETFIAKLSEIRQTVDQLLTQLQLSEHDKFAAHLYRSRREFRSVCDRSGKSGKPIERCVISTFRVAESLGFKGDYRQWEHLLRIGD
jgi:hypothetical protein